MIEQLQLSELQSSIYAWCITFVWCLVYTLAVIEAHRRWNWSRERLVRARRRNSEYEWAAKLRNRRSRNMLIGFYLGLLAGYASVARLVLIAFGVLPPIPRDTSLAGVGIAAFIILMGFFFWRAKHADTEADERADELALARLREEERAEDGPVDD